MSESARAVKDEKGYFLYYEGFVENVSEKKKARQLLLQAKEAAEKSSKMKSDFIQQMSHEIRTPITAIINNINMLKYMLSGNENNGYEEQFNTINQGGMRIIRTIDLIIDMSEIQSGNYKTEIKKHDLINNVLNDLMNKYEGTAATKNISLVKKYFSDPCFVHCDIYSASQVFEQVIDNALKFTNEGTVSVNIIYEKNFYIVSVKDTGIGISEEYLSHIFEPFSQEEQGTNRRYEGNGLGLALAFEYCKINKWSIAVESSKDISTEVKIRIPRNN